MTSHNNAEGDARPAGGRTREHEERDQQQEADVYTDLDASDPADRKRPTSSSVLRCVRHDPTVRSFLVMWAGPNVTSWKSACDLEPGRAGEGGGLGRRGVDARPADPEAGLG